MALGNRDLKTPHLPPEVVTDSILGLVQVFKKDSRKEKVDLLVGILKKRDEILLFDSVKRAQLLYLEQQTHKNYLPISGDSQFLDLLKDLLWPQKENPLTPSIQMQTLGATGAISLSAALAKAMGYESVLLSNPSWPNHARLFQVAGLSLSLYDHQPQTAFLSLKKRLESLEKPSFILLQPLCHNPTGYDFNLEELLEVFEICAAKNHLIHFDVPYVGLKNGFEKDADFIGQITKRAKNWLLSYSCAKNMTLYGERLGALYAKFESFDRDSLHSIESYLCHLARASYSNPACNGSGIAKKILSDKSLKSEWLKELEEARSYLQEKRNLLVSFFKEAGFTKWAEGVKKQSGMFGYFDLSLEKAVKLREEFAIYLPLEGRVNLTSIEPDVCMRLVDALKKVMSLDEIRR